MNGAVRPAQRVTPFADPRDRLNAGTFGMRLFLLSLGILFAASVIGYVWIRLIAIGQRLDLPTLPIGLWLSTAILLASSGSMQWALVAGRAGDAGRLRAAMVTTVALGLAFLLVQAWCWVAWAGPMRAALGETDHAFLLTSFFVLTGLHAMHVVGGLVALGIVTARAFAGRYSAQSHAGVVYTAMYWHFLDAVWLVLFATLMVG